MLSIFKRYNDSGFTMVEFLLVLTIISMLMIFVFSGCTRGMIQAYEDEALAHLTVIRTALERYAIDHDGEYPAYILGGDTEGWDAKTGCETIITRPPFGLNLKQTNLEGGGARPPKDPLIDGGYLDTYPENPFVKNNSRYAPTFSGGVENQPGTGDVRFGFNSLKMGNVLDDPRFLWSRYRSTGKGPCSTHQTRKYDVASCMDEGFWIAIQEKRDKPILLDRGNPRSS